MGAESGGCRHGTIGKLVILTKAALTFLLSILRTHCTTADKLVMRSLSDSLRLPLKPYALHVLLTSVPQRTQPATKTRQIRAPLQ